MWTNNAQSILGHARGQGPAPGYHHVHIDCEVRPASCSIGTVRLLYREVERPEREAHHSLPTNVRLKKPATTPTLWFQCVMLYAQKQLNLSNATTDLHEIHFILHVTWPEIMTTLVTARCIQYHLNPFIIMYVSLQTQRQIIRRSHVVSCLGTGAFDAPGRRMTRLPRHVNQRVIHC